MLWLCLHLLILHELFEWSIKLEVQVSRPLFERSYSIKVNPRSAHSFLLAPIYDRLNICVRLSDCAAIVTH